MLDPGSFFSCCSYYCSNLVFDNWYCSYYCWIMQLSIFANSSSDLSSWGRQWQCRPTFCSILCGHWVHAIFGSFCVQCIAQCQCSSSWSSIIWSHWVHTIFGFFCVQCRNWYSCNWCFDTNVETDIAVTYILFFDTVHIIAGYLYLTFYAVHIIVHI